MKKQNLRSGDVVQLNETTGNKHFIGALMIVTEPKSFGAVGCVHGLDRGHAYYRASWENMDYIGHTNFTLVEGDNQDG